MTTLPVRLRAAPLSTRALLIATSAWTLLGAGTAMAQVATVPGTGSAAGLTADQPTPSAAGSAASTTIDPAAPTPGEDIVVTGSRPIAESIAAALRIQKESPALVSVVSADAAGRLPDQNVAQAVSRLPGVGVQRDQGQARYINLRGGKINWTTLSVDGINIVSPEGRDARFDSIPSAIASQIVVRKAVTPNMTGETIAGNVDIVTRSAFDYNGPHIAGKLGGGYVELGKRQEYEGQLVLSDRWDTSLGEIGAVFSGSYYQRDMVTDNAETDWEVVEEDRRPGFEDRVWAREIRDLIADSVRQVEASARLIRTAGTGIGDMAAGVHRLAGNVSEISASSDEQSTGLAEISAAVQQLDQITQRNAQMVGQAVHQAETLEHRASTLSRAVTSFRLQQGTADEAMALVGRAVAVARTTPAARLPGLLTDPAQRFHDRDMYVFALDAGGTYRAFGGNPAKVGSRVQDIPGIDGAGLIAAIVAQAERGPGWVEYDIANPATGRVQTKMSFVQQCGGLYLGCGVYKSLVAPA